MRVRYLLTFISFLCAVQFGYGQDKDFLIISRNTAEFTMWDGTTIRGFGFNDGLGNPPLPAPTLNMNEGDSVVIDLWNISQGAPHTIHLHGLDVNQQNDGVPHLSFSVPHMEHGFYRFRAPHPGTYLYHCHVASTIHVQAGMYGMIIVRPKHGLNQTWDGGYWYTDEQNWLASEIDTFWHKDSVLNHDHDTSLMITPIHIPKYAPQYFLINGKSQDELGSPETALRIHKDETLFLRIANVGFLANRIEFPSGFNMEIVSSDGRPIPQAERTDTLWVYPGERYGVLLKPTSAIIDSVRFSYVDMNTLKPINVQFVPATTEFISSKEVSQQFGIKLFPVPSTARETLVLELSEPMDKDKNLVIIDALGREVFSTTLERSQTQRHEISAQLAPGIYRARLTTFDGEYSATCGIVIRD